jgi:DNA-binding response OmpR family regulator
MVSMAQPGRCTIPAPAEPVLSFADLTLEQDTYEVRRGRRLIELSPTESRLLRYLMLNPGRVLTRTQLLDHVWDYDFGGSSTVVSTYVIYLRRKLASDGPELIHTQRAVGVSRSWPASWSSRWSRWWRSTSARSPPCAATCSARPTRTCRWR